MKLLNEANECWYYNNFQIKIVILWRRKISWYFFIFVTHDICLITKLVVSYDIEKGFIHDAQSIVKCLHSKLTMTHNMVPYYTVTALVPKQK